MSQGCWMMNPDKPPCFIQLGRFGDIIIILPALREIANRTGMQPIVIVSTDYASVLDGVSYVKPHPVHWDWWSGVPAARKLAAEMYGGGIVPQWWHDSPEGARLAVEGVEGATVLQCHGIGWGVDVSKWPNFQTSMWLRAGFTVEEMMTLPLVFDRRDAGREQVLVTAVSRVNPKPILLMNFLASSAPLPAHPEIYRVIQKFSSQFNIVDLGRIRATRIYDLLGLMDRAVGLVTVDTATMHLAYGSKVPFVAYTPNRWSTGVPRGNCKLEIKYDDAIARTGELETQLNAWAADPGNPVSTGSGGFGTMKL